MAWELWTFTSDAGRKPVDEWLRSLDAAAKAAMMQELRLLRLFGTELAMPHARSMGDGIWEIRARGPDGVYRVLYFHWFEHTFGLLHGFTKKTQRTPGNELRTARERRAIWLARQNERK